ncbi:MAG: hypothetical protein KGZ37_02575 [Nitrosarchaeum sp.]|nr:hypothetical protein [Nitrosarchaeum sp.]
MIKKRECTALIAIVALCFTFQSNAFSSPVPIILTGDESSIDLKIDETVDINPNFQITLVNILDDSRCPSDVTCIWEGTISAEIKIMKNGESRGTYVIPIGLADGMESQLIDDFYVMLYDVKPYPVSTKQIESSEYVATLIISQVTEKMDPPLKQFKLGIPINDTKCSDDLRLVIKSSNSSPACVKPETVNKLLLRGWAFDLSFVSSFEECESAGNPVMESYPRQCTTPDGKHFVEQINPKMMNPESKCEKYGGTWSAELNKCESLLTLDEFTKILFETQDIDSIFEQLGKPHDDIGSGIHIYVYYLNDETQIWIGYTDEVIYVKHMDADGNLLDILYEMSS